MTRSENEKYLRRTLSEIGAELGLHPADAMLDLALSEDLRMKFRWENKTAVWQESVRESMKHPSMLMGVSDGGAHLDRDDGADLSSYFLRHWVLDREEWTLEEGIRQLSQVPAALAGFAGRTCRPRAGGRTTTACLRPWPNARRARRSASRPCSARAPTCAAGGG